MRILENDHLDDFPRHRSTLYSNRFRVLLLLFVANQLTLNDLARLVTLQQCCRSLDRLQCIEAKFERRSPLLLLENERWSLVIELFVRFSPHPACRSVNTRHPAKACAKQRVETVPTRCVLSQFTQRLLFE